MINNGDGSMLVRFSVSTMGGLEIFSHEPEKSQEVTTDPALVSGFMDAMQMYSESMGAPIRQIQLSNSMLYVRTYGDFTVRLLLGDKMKEEEIDQYFEKISIETIPLADEFQKKGQITNKDAYLKKLLVILDPLIQDPFIETKIQSLAEKKVVPKISLAGLANAGKTSIKNMFFENWSKDKAGKTKPTIGVEITPKFLEFLKEKVVIFDFGGQTDYRKQHLEQEKIWSKTSLLIFVVDIQDPSTFKLAKEFLTEIWQVVSETNKRKPKLSIFLHKCDAKISIEGLNRAYLRNNIKEFLFHFKEFLEIANLHLTTITDSSSNVALIKALYFSLPDVIIKRLLEDEFIDYFENNILPQFSILIQNGSSDETFQELRDDIRNSAMILGRTLGMSMQKAWMNYFMGEWTPKQKTLSSGEIKVVQQGKYLNLTIPDWTAKDYPKDLTTTLIDGVLEGILKTFHLDPAEKIEEQFGYITWRVTI